MVAILVISVNIVGFCLVVLMFKTKAGPTAKEQLDRLRSAGFDVRAEGNRWTVQKDRCVATLESGPEGLRFAHHPGFLLGGEVFHLMDGGFQKFLVGKSRRQ